MVIKLDNEKVLSDLIRRVWITKKSRIEASERILKKHSLYQGLLVYYSIVIVACSIWNIQPRNTDGRITEASLFLTIVSISSSLFSLYISTKNLQEKYFNLKINYIELDNIYGKLNVIDPTNSSHEIREIQKQYNNLLFSVDNHEKIDYYRVLLNDQKEKEQIDENKLKGMDNYVKKFDRKETFYKIAFCFIPILLPIILKFFICAINALYPTT